MKVLFTGTSSFTGYWFVSQLAKAGHDVLATFTRADVEAYRGDVRGERVACVVQCAQPVFSCRFGDEPFLELVRRERIDLLCHHAADVSNYKSPDFDVSRAVANNSNRASDVLKALADKGDAALMLTGSVFEPGEGAGSDGLPAFSPYGLSKSLSAEIFEQCSRDVGVRMGKFVIPNPFGPWEDPRFTAYLLRTWAAGGIASVRTPAYVRDNIHVSLLAQAYIGFCESVPKWCEFQRTNPSGYIESQGEFAERVACEMRRRTGWECRLECVEQRDFEEPRVRTNTQPVEAAGMGWDETTAWDDLAAWYVS